MKNGNKISRSIEKILYEDYLVSDLSQFPEKLRYDIYNISDSKAEQLYLIKTLSSIEAWIEVVKDYLVPGTIEILAGGGIPALFTYEVVSSFTHDTILSGMIALFVYGGFAKLSYSQLRKKIEDKYKKIKKEKERCAKSRLEDEKEEIAKKLSEKLKDLLENEDGEINAYLSHSQTSE